ncbi:MAG: hypothetical protein PHN82_02260 [bacterium]|nr:hypothetical protein [bacterium]
MKAGGRRRGIRAKVLVALCSLALSCIAAELLFRRLLASDCAPAIRFKKADLYASWFGDDDYWKLLHRWEGRFPPPAEPHPLLGWIGAFSRGTYLHDDTRELRGRRPVLLYGNSFAQCVGSTCFQEILNGDPEFGAAHFMLNYGVGGYGMDQAYLLLRESAPLYGDPFIVFAVYIENIDRNLLSFRTGQKPYFRIIDGRLRLQGVPINPDPEAFLRDHPAAIPSYLWRLLMRAASREHPYHSARRRDEKEALARGILDGVIRECGERGLDFIFVLFHDWWDGPPCWRGRFFRDYFESRGVPYIWSADLMRERAAGVPLGELISPESGHPTTRYNRILAAEIKRRILERRPP